MNWPSQINYNDAVANPSVCFSDEDLKHGSVLLDKLGLPSVYAGGFANVYRLTAKDGHKWAVRFFLLHHEDSQERYSAISSFLQKERLPFMVDFTYQPRGIQVKSQWYPMLKMEWVDGQCLDQYVREVLQREPAKLLNLGRALKDMIISMRSAGFAHGDLQHANIMVTGAGALQLVDYDDIFVPVLRGKKNNGLGYPAYQHPLRRDGSYYNENVDRFSALVIYLSIIALTIDPSLLTRYKAFQHENFLFRVDDFLSPGHSALFRELLSSADMQVNTLAKALHEACLGSIDSVPDLLEMLSTEPLKTNPMAAGFKVLKLEELQYG